MKQHHKYRQKQGGFTLVELIVVIAIIGILAALVVPSVTGYIERAQAATCQHNIQSAAQMLDQVVAQDMGSYTNDDLTPLLGDIIDNNGSYFSKPIKCPSGGTYEYEAHWAPNGSLQCTITCSKHEGIEGSKTVAKKLNDEMTERMNKIFELKNNPHRSDEENALLRELTGTSFMGIKNDALRTKTLEMYDGQWPELEKEITDKSLKWKGKTLYVQPYVIENCPENFFVYANENTTIDTAKDPWKTNAIYNPDNNTWYERVSGDFRLTSVKNEEDVAKLKEELNDTTKWRAME